MTNIIEFPGLGLSLEISNVAFRLFGIDIYWYGVCIGLGLLLAIAFAYSQRKRFGVDGDRMFDVVFVGLICAIIGGRLYYVIFTDHSYSTFGELINLRLGGIGVYGSIIAAFISAAFMCKWRKVPVLPLFDLAGMGFFIGQACGRWGNFFNQEAFGKNTTLPWGMISPTTTAYLASQQAKLAAEGILVEPFMPVHPTFLYESLWCVVGFLLMFFYRKHRKFNGEIFLFYVMWYGLGRFFIEGLRTDSLMIGFLGLRVSQVVAASSALVALAIWVVARIKTKGKPLVVPEVPPHVANVKIDGLSGRTTVTITWPGNTKEPTRAQKQESALAVLAAQGAENKDVDTEINEEKQEDDK